MFLIDWLLFYLFLFLFSLLFSFLIMQFIILFNWSLVNSYCVSLKLRLTKIVFIESVFFFFDAYYLFFVLLTLLFKKQEALRQLVYSCSFERGWLAIRLFSFI